MTDDLLKRIARGGGCRLCLAPDTECVPIFATAAADKEPLPNKILSCVGIKILPADRMSNRVCHACISFLNSWQSFKNRCYVAQKKQQSFLDLLLAKERAKQKIENDRQRQLQQQGKTSASDDQQRILKNALLNSTMRANAVGNTSIDVSFIKEEPEDITSDIDEMDPTQFLAQENDDEMEIEEHPPILASLGLTHISHQQNTENANNDQMDESYSQQNVNNLIAGRSQASCTICHMQFSNRANARRHERNIHGIRISVQGAQTIIQQKDRPEISITTSTAAAPTAALKLKRPLDAPIIYDYTKPELYRTYLTEPRLNFIRRHLEFLEQYQTMTCKCCNKQFPTYKFFMAHMRKKYDTLSRNLCFKCLKQFQTKPQFIAHLKKRNCLNLYRVFMADDTISKEPLPNAPIRHGSKEIIANKTYGCRLCTETFRLKSDFRTHVVDTHSDAQKSEDAGNNACGYCNLEFEDGNERRRHFSNVECMVFLMCGTCEEKFNSHPEYIEHVYATHIPSANEAETPIKNEFLLDDENGLLPEDPTPSTQSKARSPQNCTVCGKQYNNYYNVLRHMESKHPDQVPTTYRCDRCKIGYPRQVELREHMLRVHNERLKFDAIKMKREQFSCRECKASFESKDSWLAHQLDDHSKFWCNQCDEECDKKEEFLTHLASHSEAKSFKCPVCQHSFSSERGFETHLSVVHNMTKEEVAESNLDNSDFGELPVECAVEINGEDDTDNDDINDADDLDGNDADIDETLEKPAKRIKLDLSATDNEITTPPNNETSLSTTCRICKQSFTTRIQLMQHMRSSHSSVSKLPSLTSSPHVAVQTHNVNNRLRCRICQKRIHTKNGYKRHMLTVHNVKDCVFIKCTLCPSEFSNDKGLKVHMFRTHNITVQQMQADESLVPIPKQESTSPTPSPIVPRTESKQMFECNICHTVYRSRDQLKSHRSIVHNITDGDLNETDLLESLAEENAFTGESWWQCRFCNESFNASKKLTIHMNSHSEYDNKETKCKDCGNVYGTRKSLWVHRQKKHPRLPNPSPCELCDKTFFDKTELFYHLKTHSNDDVFSHLQAMQEQLEAEQESRQKQEQSNDAQENFSCHICSQRFHDKRVLSKHLRVHEHQKQTETSFNNSALAAMLADTNISTEENLGEYSYPSYKGQMVENGEFACDMCPKKFSHVNALKVHRGWHFRSPDGRQITDSNSIWRPDVGSNNKNKRSRAANPPVCPFCNSTFASGNNLRRHIVEVHKRNEAKMMRENGVETTFIEKECECASCGITFNTRPEWVEHKISHARTMKPSTTYEWGCEICGKVFTRKERLLVHMTSHMNGGEEEINQRKAEMGFESNSQSSMSSLSQQQSNEATSLRKISGETKSSSSVSLLKQPSLLKQSLQGKTTPSIQNEVKLPLKTESVESLDLDYENSNSYEQEEEQNNSCGLCDLFFKSAKELKQHVKSHIESIGGQPEESNLDEYDEGDDEEEDGHDDGNGNSDIEDHYEIDEGVEGVEEEMGEEEADMVEEDFEDDDVDEDEHEERKPEISGFNCRLCGSSSESPQSMIKCMDNHNVKTSIQCEQCQLYFTNNNQLENHEMLCHPQEDYDEDSD
ncbi:zinc finger protein hangover-like isoform X2 [Contarinia nasturtii]|uniref:zinc finger protein hangover-like isoform X2 n=1 Tax=Contarinia nasturtii TaxID=265458 RepID=UPI0012D37D86|nr:zinc finger protein hangover-like isoform X2 [Contarinia nasturtii]